jgi:hypothetical protein
MLRAGEGDHLRLAASGAERLCLFGCREKPARLCLRSQGGAALQNLKPGSEGQALPHIKPHSRES